MVEGSGAVGEASEGRLNSFNLILYVLPRKSELAISQRQICAHDRARQVEFRPGKRSENGCTIERGKVIYKQGIGEDGCYRYYPIRQAEMRLT